MKIIYYIEIGLAFGFLLMPTKTKSQEIEIKPDIRYITFDVPKLFYASGLFSPQETLRLEKSCPSGSSDDWRSTTGYSRNTVEFGLTVPVPQSLPAESHYYTRYTCGKGVGSH